MNRRIVLIAVAVVLALFGTFAVYSYAHNADERAVAGGRAVKVLIATKRVAAGTSWADAVKGGTMSVQNMPASSAPNSALTSLSAGVANTAVAQSDIAPGQVVLREAFGAATPQTGVLAIPKGKIAISVSLGSDADVAGYVSPQSQVIVFVTSALKEPAGTKNNKLATAGDTLSVTRTVVSRASVIATSAAAPTDTVGKTADGGSSQGAVLITLALSQSDAQRVIMSQNAGQLYLGLLSDTSVVTQDGGVVNAGAFHPAPIWVK
jgi:pilus assembly protein CpaB